MYKNTFIFNNFKTTVFFFTVEIFKWNNKIKNSICTYTVYIDMTHAFVFQYLVQVLQLSAPFNPWNRKAGSLEALLIPIYAVASQTSLGCTLSGSPREGEWYLSKLTGTKSGLSSHIYIYSISFCKTSVLGLSLRRKQCLRHGFEWPYGTEVVCANGRRGRGAGNRRAGFESRSPQRQELS